ncbi:hypothetical protein MCB1EB_1597 [Mycoavidus cysteinexigens]|uniref:Uncharacterized protein n=1 Tax=Mycoavidus cysteinexigens TaxID=1553431 RepID=A0A2Z6EWK0_9BURK|nr:NACHT domain-containing protein [Mycoavidus cysteinexigens]BBE09758.1 hypothetical protein MCB1EB_1597 [Mycoavidus cysteinexigens]GAM53905.1 hypothetical protein EBME_2368 [bacterium endosymbiont of Mortierella elongata FMR23-6]GLR02282.1 hypothetical protein GCM10007934_20980 [Mycoavidus cysteinexigens]
MLPISPNQSTQPSLASYIPKLASAFSDTQERADDLSESNVQIGNGFLNNLTIGNNNTANNHIHLAAADSKLIETLMLQHIFALQPNIKPLVNLDSAIEALQKRYLKGLQEDNEVKDALSNYVEPEGMELYDSTRFDLKSKVQDFLNSDKKVLLLLGEAGSGKSTFNRDLAVSLWEAYIQGGKSENMPIPVFIGLSSLLGPDRNLVSAFFERHGFSKERIKELQSKHRFVLILDGFDEIEHRQQVFYKDNELNDWKGAKIIISSRPEYLGPNYQYKFHPPGERTALQEYRLAPFSEETIKRYIDRYSEIHPDALWSAEKYKKELEEPSLKELVSNPFLLKITLSVLPELSQRLQIENQRITRIAIYDQFVESWFGRSQQRLNQILEVGSKERKEFKDLEREGFAGFGVDFSKELALEMYQAGEVITHYQAVTHARWKKNNTSTEADWHKRLLSNEDTTTVLMRLNAPLICQDRPNNLSKEYRFIHKSLRDYFVARGMWEEFSTDKKLEASSWFNSLNIVKDPAVLQFLAERMQQERELKEYLLSVVEQSKGEDGAQFERGAANAITVLVRAGVQFNGEDLKGIRIPGADLSYGVFDSVQLQKADLSEVNLRGAWLRKANFNGTDLAGVQFNEKPSLYVSGMVYDCCYSSDGLWFAVVDNDVIDLYDADTLEQVDIYSGHKDKVTSIAFSPNSDWIVSGSYDNTVKLWNVLGEQSLKQTYIGHQDAVWSVAFSLDGKWIASGSDDKTLNLWDVSDTQAPIHTYPKHKDRVGDIAFSPNGQWIASIDDHKIKLWNVSSPWTLAHTYVGDEKLFHGIAFSPDGQWLASSDLNDAVNLWNIVSGERNPVHRYFEHGDGIQSIAFSHDSQLIASGSDDSTVKLWSVLGERALIHTYAGQENSIFRVTFSPDRQWLAYGGDGGKVMFLRVLDTPNIIHAYDSHDSSVQSVEFSRDGRWFASSSWDKTVRLWDLSTDVPTLARIYTEQDYINSISLAPDGQSIVSGIWDGAVKLWSVSDTTAPTHEYGRRDERVTSVSFSLDGKWIASGSYDATVKLWHMSGERGLEHTYKGHEDNIWSVAFSPNGCWLASGSGDKTIRLWDVSVPSMDARIYSEHEGAVKSVAFSPDSQWLASGSRDNTVRLWSVRKGDCQAILESFVGSIYAVAWGPSLPGGWMLATGGEDKAVRFWRVCEDSGQIDQVKLEWTSLQDSLMATGALIGEAVNLSESNKLLLGLQGAVLPKRNEVSTVEENPDQPDIGVVAKLKNLIQSKFSSKTYYGAYRLVLHMLEQKIKSFQAQELEEIEAEESDEVSLNEEENIIELA